MADAVDVRPASSAQSAFPRVWLVFGLLCSVEEQEGNETKGKPSLTGYQPVNRRFEVVNPANSKVRHAVLPIFSSDHMRTKT